MAQSAQRQPDKTAALRPLRPVLLAGGLGLIWFVEGHGGVEEDAPGWSIGIILGVRLFADLVGAWLVVSLLRLAYVAARLGLGHFGIGPRREELR